MRALVLFLTISRAVCFGQILGDASAVNAGNLAGSLEPNYGVAPGSRFALLGSALGATASQEDFPLAKQLGEASVTVTVGGTTLDCWVLSARADRVVALLPSAMPAGDGTVTLTRSPLTATTKIHVVPVAFGLLARDQTELGPAFAFHDNMNPITLLDSAVAGENVTIRGTGLGAVSGDEGAGPVPADMNVPLDIWVGGVAASLVSARRSGTLAGIDEIVIQVPPGVQGCSVPVAVRAAGAVSNYVTIPIHDGGGPCSDAFGFTPDALSSLPGDRDPRIGVISLSRTGISNEGFTAQTDVGRLNFASYSADQLFSRRGATPATMPGACVVLYISDQRGTTSADTITGRSLLTGTVTISGPKGTKTIDPNGDGILGQGMLLPALPGGFPGLPFPASGDLFLEPGSYTITGTSSPDMGAFSVAFQLPAAVQWSNQPDGLAALTLMIPRDQDLHVEWTNGNDPDLVMIQGFGLTPDASGAAFACTERASKGSFNVPSWVLSSIPPTVGGSTLFGPGGGLSVGMVSGAPGRFSADQLDLGLVAFSTNTFVGIGGWR